jgi:cytochrome c oxidase assembly protein subunit 15
MPLLSTPPRIVRAVSLAAVVGYALLVVSGGAVRLTGSGLGCPDWPSCYQHRITAAVSFHPMVEFLNRLVTVGVSVVSVAAFLAAVTRSPRRRDISWPAAGLLAGLAAQIILGGAVVLLKLNPYLVAFHFLLTIIVLGDAVLLFHRSTISDSVASTPSRHLVGNDLRLLAGVLLGALAVVSTAGTFVTGTGPHAGGPGAKRIPFAFRSVAELHSSLAWMLLGLAVASLLAFRHGGAPVPTMRRVRLFFELVMVQGALGYTQYFLHDAAAIVELHLAGVTALWLAAMGLWLSLHGHPEPAVVEVSANGLASAKGAPTVELEAG